MSAHSSLPALFLPGWGLGPGPLESLLAETGWQVCPLPGGATPPPATFAAAVDALLDTLPARCHLGGWSLGALLALACAARAPERVASLTLIAATSSFLQREDWPHGLPAPELAAFAEAVRTDGAKALPRFVMNFCRGDEAARATAKQLTQQASPMSQAELDRGLDWLAQADLRTQVPSIACPVTLLHGEADPLMPLAAAQWLQEHLPQARLQTWPGKAHAPFAPDPAPFLVALRRP